jgi:ABC-type branched-subunit amino acid transport system ATPase component
MAASHHHGAVLEAGVVALAGSGQELPAGPEVARFYLGAAATDNPRGDR